MKTFFTLALLCLAGTAHAQECPYPPSEAIPDTLNPAGYYPLAVGNAWEYERLSMPPDDPGQLWRDEVVGDTLVDGVRWYKVRTRSYAPSGQDTLLVYEERCCQYYRIDEGGLLRINFDTASDSLGYPSKACYRDHGSLVIVDKSVSGEDPTSAIKSFSVIEFGTSYEYGWGPVQYNEAYLTYAEVGSRTRGIPFEEKYRVVITPAEEEPPRALDTRLRLWPNPASEQVFIELSADLRGNWTLRLYDVLGRLVLVRPVSASEVRLTLDVTELAPGVYRVVAEKGGRPSVSRALVVL